MCMCLFKAENKNELKWWIWRKYDYNEYIELLFVERVSFLSFKIYKSMRSKRSCDENWPPKQSESKICNKLKVTIWSNKQKDETHSRNLYDKPKVLD